MSYFSKRALRWAAPVALVGALGLAACGDNDDSVALRVAAPSAVGVGSDQHLNNKAVEIASQRANRGAGHECPLPERLLGRREGDSHPGGQPSDRPR